ncbi:MAG: hypothetical protein EPO13_10235 [Actinomycetota bacterium]|nr:MAG: hypothetical protein EPO13_10235 [Actinomycetota bacterium]
MSKTTLFVSVNVVVASVAMGASIVAVNAAEREAVAAPAVVTAAPASTSSNVQIAACQMKKGGALRIANRCKKSEQRVR